MMGELVVYLAVGSLVAVSAPLAAGAAPWIGRLALALGWPAVVVVACRRAARDDGVAGFAAMVAFIAAGLLLDRLLLWALHG